MEFNRIGAADTGRYAGVKKPGTVKPKEAFHKVSDSVSISGKKDDSSSLDLGKVGRALLSKTKSRDWPLEPAWVFQGSSDYSRMPVAGPDGRLYAADGNRIKALDAKTGEVKQEFELPEKIDNFVITEKGYVVATDRDFIYGFNKRPGEVKWKNQMKSWGKPVTDSDREMTVGPNETVYVADYQVGIYAINAKSGKTRWENQMISRISETPVLSKDGKSLFCADPTSQLSLVDTKNGDQLWTGRTRTITGDVIYSAKPDSGFLVGYDRFYEVKSYDSEEGDSKWFYNADTGLSCKPVFDETRGTAYLVDGKKVVSLKDGDNIKWEKTPKELTEDVTEMAVGHDGTLFVGQESDTVLALDPSRGNLKWRFKVKGEKALTPMISDDGNLYLKGKSGKIYAYPLNIQEALKKDKPEKSKKTEEPKITQGKGYVEIGGVKLAVNKNS